MRKPIFVFYAFLAAVFFIAGVNCGGCDETAPGATGVGWDTDPCETDDDCLGSCADGTCVDGGSTGFDGEECAADDECRGTCEGGVCTGAGTGDDGAECSQDSECKGTCEDGTCTDAPANSTANNTMANNAATNNAATNNAATNNAANNTTTNNNSTANNGSGTTYCDGNPCACDDGEDNDGDGLIDGQDPECTGPYDDDEGTFATGIPGDNIDFCQDCFFDGNSGEGDDGCRYHTECLYGNTPPMGGGGCFDCEVSQMCFDNCRPRTPNGCDCFGCCEVLDDDGETHYVLLEETCSLDNLDDEDACPRCVQSDECVNECGRCELCPGKTVEDLPDDCGTNGGGGDGGDGDPCTVDGDCAGADCQSGTCSGGGSGGDGDPCTQDGDCAGTSTCEDGTCGGGGGDDDPTHTCDDGEQVCVVSGDCPNNYYCLSGCCLPVVQ